MRTLGLVLSAFCMATVLALLAGAGYLVATGRLDRVKAARIVAVIHGLELFAEPAPTVEARQTAAGTQGSDALAVRSQQLDLRERFIEGQRSDLEAERRKLMAERSLLAEERTTFKKERIDWEEGEKAKGIDDIVQIIGKVSIEVAKDMLMKEELDSAVILIRKLPLERQAKIFDACTTAEEIRKRDEISRRIRDGQPPLPAEKAP